jgi:hypothetical protein
MRDSTRPRPPSPGPSSRRTDVARQVEGLRGDILGRLVFIAEALEEGDAGMAHAVVLDAIDDLRVAA